MPTIEVARLRTLLELAQKALSTCQVRVTPGSPSTGGWDASFSEEAVLRALQGLNQELGLPHPGPFLSHAASDPVARPGCLHAPSTKGLDCLLALKPMESAPKPAPGTYPTLLVLDAWEEYGRTVKGFALVYWLDADERRPAGWHGANCTDLRNPVGWYLRTSDLSLG